MIKLFRVDIDGRCLPAPRLGHRTTCFADGAVGIELLVALKTRKLVIFCRDKMARNTKYAEPRYTAGTRPVEDPIEVERFL